MQEYSTVLGNMVKSIVDNPEKVVVTETVNGDDILVTLNVAEEDMGMVIGKGGRIAKAIRTVIKAAAAGSEKKVNVDIR